MSTHGKDKMVILDGFEEPKGHMVGEAQGVLGSTCELLFVRGTTSFYNKKLKIVPIGEGAVWNVKM